jgi:MFS family permease
MTSGLPASGGPPPPADWRRAVALQLFVAVLSSAAIHATRPTVTYRALELGGSTFDIGLIQAANSILPTLLAVAVGRLIDRNGERAYLAISLGVMALASLIATYAGSLFWLGVSQLVLGLGQIGLLVAGQSLVANYGPREGRDARFGHYATAHSFGQLLGPAAAALVLSGGIAVAASGAPLGPLGNLLPTTQTGLAFLVTALITAGGVAAALMLPRPRRRLQADGTEAKQAGTLAMTGQVFRRRGMPAAMVVSIVVASSTDMVIAYLPAYGEQAGLPVVVVGLLLTIRGIAALVARLFMSQLINLLGRERALALSMAAAGVGLLVLPFTTTVSVLAVLMIGAGMGTGLGQPMTISWVAARSPRSERATALGLRITGNRASLLVIPPVLGAIAGAAGVAAIFVVLAGALLGGSALAASTPFDELVTNPEARAVPEPEQPSG